MRLVLARRISRGLDNRGCQGSARARAAYDLWRTSHAWRYLSRSCRCAQFVSLDVHKLSIVAATLPPAGGQPKVERIETTEKAIRRFIDRLGGGEGLAVCYEAGSLSVQSGPVKPLRVETCAVGIPS
jgi:hypothetical protein